MKYISTTIKRKHLDKILSGEKTIERKVATPYWNPRLNNILRNIKLSERGRIEGVGLNLLCGQENYKFRAASLFKARSACPKEIDGVLTNEW